MVSVEDLSMEFAARPLFAGVSFVVDAHDRIGLVGRNGAGKSTLLRLLAGELSPGGGRVVMAKGVRVAYLPQGVLGSGRGSIWSEAAEAFAPLQALEEEQRATERALGEASGAEALRLAEQLERLRDEIALGGGSGWRGEVERALTGLGFKRADFGRSLEEFSGGWRMRVELAKLLLGRPDLLLLDEPTNHLDLGSIVWLEQWLRRRGGAVVVVSHDRAFLNRVTARTLELSCGRLYDYGVPYDAYVQLRAERRAAQLRAQAHQQAQLAEARAFIERFRYKPTKAAQVQSRVKWLERQVAIEVDEEETRPLRWHWPACGRGAEWPLVLEEVGKSYGEHRVVAGVGLSLRRGEKVAWMGNNGAGKSTLVRCVMGEEPCEGQVRIGQGVRIGYFAQDSVQRLDGGLTVRQTVEARARGETRARVDDLLGAFLFGGEAADKEVSCLSGGERSRLALLCLLMEPVNFLILDEPTNHLDMAAKEVLKGALRAFEGGAVIVSHDRDFLEGLVSRVFVFADGGVREWMGGLDDFLADLQGGVDSLLPGRQPEATATPASTSGAAWAERKARARALKAAERRAAEQGAEVERIEEERKAVAAQLCTPEGAADGALHRRLKEVEDRMEAAWAQWEAAEQALEALRKETEEDKE